MTGKLITTALLLAAALAGCSKQEAVEERGGPGDDAAPDLEAPSADGHRTRGTDEESLIVAASAIASERDTVRHPGAGAEGEGASAQRVAERPASVSQDDSAGAGERPAGDRAGPGGSGVERPAPPGEGLSVLRAYICKGIERREPIEAGRSFVSSGDTASWLCCFTEVAGAARADSIVHVWYWGDREMARVVLEVQGPRWRTWSSKKILEEWRGEWHVDVVDSGGRVLRRLDFSVE